MNRVYNTIGRVVTWAIWVPVDRTVCRFAELTDSDRTH